MPTVSTAIEPVNLEEFDLEALLKLFPLRSGAIEDTAMLGRASDNKRWVVVYQDYQTIADTPKQAVINLLKQIGIA